jgi:hypothetical protein
MVNKQTQAFTKSLSKMDVNMNNRVFQCRVCYFFCHFAFCFQKTINCSIILNMFNYFLSFSRSFPKFGRDGRKPNVKSNLRAGLANAGGGHKRFPTANKPEKTTGPVKFAAERMRKKVVITERPPAINQLEDEDEDQTEDEDLFAGPEVRPDGRMARVKADILAENQKKPESAVAASVEPFIEAFFASPSSPRPFVFTGSPRPADQFGSSSTFQPFFLPTAKSGVSSPPTNEESAGMEDDDDSKEMLAKEEGKADLTDDNTNSSEDDDNEIDTVTTERPQVQQQQQRQTVTATEETNIPRPRNRFLSRPSPASTNTASLRPATSTVEAIRAVDSSAEESSMAEAKAAVEENKNNAASEEVPAPTGGRSTGFRQRQLVKPAGLAVASKPVFSAKEEEECSDPFSCLQAVSSGEAPTGRRPRVKSNITAKKRNFWQKDAGAASAEAAGRKLRRGRKQKIPVVSEDEVDNDISDEPLVVAAPVKKPDAGGAALLDELMAGKKETEEDKTVSTQQQFAPTLRSTAGAGLQTSTAATTTSESFKDLFEEEEEEEDDLIVSSSTVSSVVFKGSPTPSPFGFFSSPQPDWDGPSKNSLGGGGFAGSPRPSFTNIGNHIDLGGDKKPARILPLDQLFFVSSTQSNKIVIGSEDVEDDVEEDSKEEEEESSDDSEEEPMTTTTTVPPTSVPSTTAAGEAAKRPSPFPSFPIRGKLLAGAGLPFPFRQSKFGKGPAVESDEKLAAAEVTNGPTTTTTASTAASEQSSLATGTTARFSSFNRGGRPTNLSFLNRKPADFVATTVNNKPVSAVQTTAAVASTTTEYGSDEEEDNSDQQITTTEESNEEVAVTTATLFSTTATTSVQPAAPAARFQVKPQLAGPSFPSGLPNRSRNFQAARKEEATTTAATTVASVKTTTEAPATTTMVKVLSVESILLDDDSENELDSNDHDDSDDDDNDDSSDDNESSIEEEEEEEKHMDESQNFEKKLTRKEPTTAVVVPSVKKALGPPPNANIRVEFKKAAAVTAAPSAADTVEDGDAIKKFFVKPDGRKPRVKSNIR